ncbi:MAG: signal peptide peptidase SppA [Lysobacterales bacterium]|jgi:protease-4
MADERSFLTRSLLGAWHFINGARKVFLNVLFLLFLYLLFLAFQPPETFRLKPDTTLVIRPYGNVVEQYSTTALDRALQEAVGQERSETRLRDMLEAIHRAAGDDDITQMVIDPNYLWGIGLAALKDLEHAVDAFRSTGKPVVALANNLSQQQYYLASLADEVWLDPNGMVWLDGYANYRWFFRDGLEKLAVEVNLFRVGDYKSAMEPYIRDDMSEEAKADGRKWLGDLWLQYLEGVAQNRGLMWDHLQDAIDNLPAGVEESEGNFAQYALGLGLVDELIAAPAARLKLALRGAPNQTGDSYRAVGVEDYLDLSESRQRTAGGGRIAVVVAEGEIFRGNQPPGRIGSLSTAEQLRRVARDDKIAALVLRINSPGGEVFATESLRVELQQVVEAGKPVVVSMGNVAASGGYWLSLAADEVWASPASITGSIGVFGMLPTFGGTLDKLGIHADGFGTTQMAGKVRLDRPLDPGMARIFQASTERTYRQFLGLVKDARGIGIENPENLDEVAQGRVWSGQQALEKGLVDQLGTFQDAIEAAARKAGLGDDYHLEWIEPEKSAFDELLADFLADAVVALDLGISASVRLPVPWLQGMLEELRFIVEQQGQFTLAAHCLCEI